jgi:hypothetical protein
MRDPGIASVPSCPAPFKRREPQSGLGTAMDRIAKIDTDLRAWERHRRELIDRRAAAIRAALPLGATLAQVGNMLGVSAVRARQMRDGS